MRVHCQCMALASPKLDQLVSGARGLGAKEGCLWQWGTWRHGLGAGSCGRLPILRLLDSAKFLQGGLTPALGFES